MKEKAIYTLTILMAVAVLALPFDTTPESLIKKVLSKVQYISVGKTTNMTTLSHQAKEPIDMKYMDNNQVLFANVLPQEISKNNELYGNSGLQNTNDSSLTRIKLTPAESTYPVLSITDNTVNENTPNMLFTLRAEKDESSSKMKTETKKVNNHLVSERSIQGAIQNFIEASIGLP